MLPSVSTLAVSVIYCVWNAYRVALLRRERLLRDRVAYMLWVMAHGPEEDYLAALRD
jgi:hypothetical protein